MKGKNVLTLPVAIGLLFLISGCRFTGFGQVINGSGNLTEEIRSFGSCHGVSLGGFGIAYVEIGNESRVRIKADDNLLPYIVTTVSDGILQIKTKSGYNLRPDHQVEFFVTVPKADYLGVSGSGDIIVPSLTVPDLETTVSGSGEIQLDELRVEALSVHISGSGDIRINSGQASEQSLSISGSGTFRAPEFPVAKASVSISGSGSATINVSRHLKARISGSGSVGYYGDPVIEQRISGSGRLVSRD